MLVSFERSEKARGRRFIYLKFIVNTMEMTAWYEAVEIRKLGLEDLFSLQRKCYDAEEFHEYKSFKHYIRSNLKRTYKSLHEIGYGNDEIREFIGKRRNKQPHEIAWDACKLNFSKRQSD